MIGEGDAGHWTGLDQLELAELDGLDGLENMLDGLDELIAELDAEATQVARD